MIQYNLKDPQLAKQRYGMQRFLNICAYFFSGIVIISCVLLLWDVLGFSLYADREHPNQKVSFNLDHLQQIVLPADSSVTLPRNTNCRFWNCLNLYRCGHGKLNVYVYPLQDYIDGASGKSASTLTREYYQILEAVIHSRYYTSNPNEACLFLPSIDLLNQDLIESHIVSRALTSLDYWNNGENHLLFNMFPGSLPDFNRSIDVNTGHAVILGGGFDTLTYRAGFDISLPVWSSVIEYFNSSHLQMSSQRTHKLIIAQLNILPQQIRVVQIIAQDNPEVVLFLQNCKSTSSNANVRCSVGPNQRRYEYPYILSKGTFCLLSRSLRLGQPDLMEMLAHNCIPVVAIDNYVLPFEDVLDWSLASVRIRESELPFLIQRLNSLSHIKVMELQHQGRWLFTRYFKDIQTITLTALNLLQDRVFPHTARSVHQWNSIGNIYFAYNNPLFLPMITHVSQGFTAVILTYDRVESLFTLIQKLALVPSLQSILVVWNNQRELPPLLSSYPAILKPLKVIQTRANKLSNRFFPYAEIETEAILTIDDDIVMLTADELDFGYEVWREFPDRIVGFPSRIHIWDNATMQWHYESEWTNQISMVLTGAAFHHKFWSHLYTYAMPGSIKDWVDEHMNCEDIAMNFLVANITNKPPIKVTPRKKFKCPECTNTEMLSADLNHMRERSACINRFARIYGRMPLRNVEFRADPVLFKDNFPEKLKRFNDVGSL